MVFYILFILLIIASISDITTKKIPNAVSLSMIILGLSWNFVFPEKLGLVGSIVGLLTGLFITLPFYIFTGMGAGDVKLVAAIGCVVGYKITLFIVPFSFMIALLFAIIFLIFNGELLSMLGRFKVTIFGLFAGVWAYQKPGESDTASYQLPFAPAISIATVYLLYPTLKQINYFLFYQNLVDAWTLLNSVF